MDELGKVLRPGGTQHACKKPDFDLKIRSGCIWRCPCGRRWQLSVKQLSSSSWEGQWKRSYWPWPR